MCPRRLGRALELRFLIGAFGLPFLTGSRATSVLLEQLGGAVIFGRGFELGDRFVALFFEVVKVGLRGGGAVVVVGSQSESAKIYT